MKRKMIWANLLHLSYNMWEDRVEPERESRYYRDYLRFDMKLWNDILQEMVDARMNMVVIDLGDGVKYESHPEIAVKKAWTVRRLKAELAKLRRMGLEPIPKLNFSTGHDAWLGPYARCVSTDTYYRVCRDLIAEVIKLFGKPRFFHLGMDEETTGHQRTYEYVVVRQYNLWWHDLKFLINQVKRGGSRPWIWSDHIWRHGEEFLENVSKTVLQSNWYYGTSFSKKIQYVQAYLDLEANRYDQIPTASNHSNDVNFERTVAFCTRNISPGRLKGFLQTPWRSTLEEFREHHMKAVQQVGRAMAK